MKIKQVGEWARRYMDSGRLFIRRHLGILSTDSNKLPQILFALN
jgi:hypothetical protein